MSRAPVGFDLAGSRRSKPEAIEPRQTTAAPERKSARSPGREGMVALSFFITPEARRQLKVHMAMQDVTLQAIGDEMLNDLFVKHGYARLGREA